VEEEQYRNMVRREVELVQRLAVLTGTNEHEMMMNFYYHGLRFTSTRLAGGKYGHFVWNYHQEIDDDLFFFGKDEYRQRIFQEQRSKMAANRDNSPPRQPQRKSINYVRSFVIMHYLYCY
jgi:hypothetical protein